MVNINSILKAELEAISLSREEILKLEKVAKSFITSFKAKGIKAYVGGSLAKGTLIKKERSQDIDIFVVFDYSEDILKLEGVLKKIKLPGKLKKVHGSRDYFQIDCDSVLLEIIPVVKNKDPELAENVTDVSLSHVKYISEEVTKNPKIADEIKLAKAFCWANRCYGAESYVKGFSGYSLEVLVIYFGGFVKFLKGISKIRVIDPIKYFKGERDVLSEINSSKTQGPVVLVDPTYKYRNVCAGLGEETFEKFKVVARNFLKSPSLEYFERKSIDVEGLRKLAGTFVEINLKTDRQEGDIAGTKMKKLLDFFVRELVRKQQKVLKKEFDYAGGQNARGYLVVVEKPEIELRGPSEGLDDAVKAFVKAKGKDVVKKKGYYWYKEKSGVAEVFKSVRKVEKEMGASAKLV
ncbi:MAG: nucleotidyltransferase domain-containing protein [Nanoarchaeota archaeon]|nr:nucleotidyltransferase domain-containing protein [Nanoarchaeota archaeon]